MHKGGFSVIAETSRSELASSRRFAENSQPSHGFDKLLNISLTFQFQLTVVLITKKNWAAKKSCHGQTPINECSISDYPSNFEGLFLALRAMLFQTVFCFAFIGSYMFISDEKVKAKNNRNRNCIFSFPWESQGSQIGSFLLCFTYPS